MPFMKRPPCLRPALSVAAVIGVIPLLAGAGRRRGDVSGPQRAPGTVRFGKTLFTVYSHFWLVDWVGSARKCRGGARAAQLYFSPISTSAPRIHSASQHVVTDATRLP